MTDITHWIRDNIEYGRHFLGGCIYLIKNTAFILFIILIIAKRTLYGGQVDCPSTLPLLIWNCVRNVVGEGALCNLYQTNATCNILSEFHRSTYRRWHIGQHREMHEQSDFSAAIKSCWWHKNNKKNKSKNKQKGRNWLKSLLKQQGIMIKRARKQNE